MEPEASAAMKSTESHAIRKEHDCMKLNRESGLAIPLLALFMVVLIVLMALAIDVGMLYTARTGAQHAADAGALAGAFTYGGNPSNPNGSATAAAISAATKNKIWGNPCARGRGDSHAQPALRDRLHHPHSVNLLCQSHGNESGHDHGLGHGSGPGLSRHELPAAVLDSAQQAGWVQFNAYAGSGTDAAQPYQP
jgi:hypothetical protein